MTSGEVQNPLPDKFWADPGEEANGKMYSDHLQQGTPVFLGEVSWCQCSRNSYSQA